jgi:peptidoglycan/xylan/chitin deacetylase (PgdA/CDA1 family)
MKSSALSNVGQAVRRENGPFSRNSQKPGRRINDFGASFRKSLHWMTVFQTFKDRLVPRICASIPFHVWQMICEVDLVIPYWHVVSDDELPHVSGLYRFRNIRQFKADLEFFLRHYSPVTEQDVISHLYGIRALPQRCVLFTFDDGFREIYDVVAPLLFAKGAQATFFLITSAIDNQHLCYPQKKSLIIGALGQNQSAATLKEAARTLSVAGVPTSLNLGSRIRAVSYRQRDVLDDLGGIFQCDFQGYLASHRPYMSAEQVKALLHQGFSVGAHSVDHPLYAELSMNEQLTQTRESMHWISERFQIKCQSLAFPYRDDGVSLDFFRTVFMEAELKVSFGVGGLIPHACPYNLPRFTTEHSDLPADAVLSRQFVRSLIRRRSRVSVPPAVHWPA